MQHVGVRYLMLFVLLLFASCKTTKKVEEHFAGAHYSASELVSQLNVGKYSVIDESKFGELHIYIYDTTQAKDTGGGFYSPLKAEIIRKDTTQTNIEIRDTLVLVEKEIKAERDSISADVKTETKRKIGHNYWIIGGVIVLLVVFFHKLSG